MVIIVICQLLSVSLYVTGKCNAVDTLGMISNEAKMRHVGCLVGHATNSDSGILYSGYIFKHSLKNEKPKTT